MDATQVNQFADAVVACVAGQQPVLPSEVAGQLEDRLGALRGTSPRHCAATTRAGDLASPYGDGTAEHVVTFRCDDVDRIGVRLGSQYGRLRVVGWSERVMAGSLLLLSKRWLPLLEQVRTLVVTPDEEEWVQMEIYAVVFPEGVREAVVG